jgi:hypothetical protein
LHVESRKPRAPAACRRLCTIGMVLMVGALTQGRLHNAAFEDLAHVIGMNRLCAAYLDLDPGIERYLVTSAHDDDAGIWQTYNHLIGPNPIWQRFASSTAFIRSSSPSCGQGDGQA